MSHLTIIPSRYLILMTNPCISLFNAYLGKFRD